MLSIYATHVILCLSLFLPLAATVSFDFSTFDRDTKLTCSPNQKGICLQGDAFVNEGLQLTKNQAHSSLASSVGRVMYSDPVRIWDPATRQMTDFTTQFSFIIHDVDSSSPSGDGIAFFLSSPPSVIPKDSAGGFLGLFANSSNSDGHVKLLAIEFDTYPNGELDSCSGDHIGIDVNSMQSVVCFTLESGIKKGTLAKARVEYNANKQTLTVSFTYDVFSSSGNLNVSHVVDLREVLPEYVSIGFSAATGSSVETHTILSWRFNSNLDVRDNGTSTLLVLMVILAGASMVGALLWLFIWNRRKAVLMTVENVCRYTVLPSENNEKEQGDIGVGSEHINETGGDEQVPGDYNVCGPEPLKDEDFSLDGISLVEAEGTQTQVVSSDTEPLTKQDGGRGEGGISLDAEYTEGDGIVCEPEKVSESGQSSAGREEGANLEDVSSDAEIVNEGGGSHIEASIPMNLLDNWSPQEIPYHVLVSATNSFSEEMMLGKGGFGPVYRGFLSDLGLDVAIKKLSERSQQGLSEYMSEVKIITQLRHRNLVKLIGWCHDHGELMLVYEFLIHGSLDNHLFKENHLLEWPIRYKILLGLASALMYLHDECEPYVLHRDVKSSNVLLDSKFDAKLADFGLARFFNLDVSSLRVSHPAGTRGYWAPEYALMARASRLSDVYSYGIVALEIACGKKAILTIQGGEEEISTTLLVEWVWDLYGKGTILDAVDKRLNGNFNRVQMERLLIVGLWCAHPDHQQRPHMRQASNALLYPETIPLPTLPTVMPPWAFPLNNMQMQMVQHSQLQLSSPNSMFSASDDSTPSLSLRQRHGDGDSETLSEPTVFTRPKPRLFERFTGWLRRRKGTSSDETVHYDRIRMITGLKEFSYDELVKATDNFSSAKMLGEGAFGAVYKGYLASGMYVAVKRFREGSSTKFFTEVMTLSRLAHRNLQKLIGWCHKRGQHLLVREYMSNGTLDRYLFCGDESLTIPWRLRYRVALSLASALCYLHNDWERCVLHRNIKSRSILLDEDFNMRLGAFAIAMQTDHGVVLSMVTIVGTFGFMAPEYMRSGEYTTASDVYSFGVVALEIACGRRWVQYDYTLGDVGCLMQRVWRYYANGILLEASDEKLMGNFDSREMERLMVVGLCCTHIDPAQRPHMVKVLRVLQLEEELPVPVPTDSLIPATSGLSRTPSAASTCDSDIDDCLR